MANKTVRTRLQVKHDSAANWQKAGEHGFTPLVGEICFYDYEGLGDECKFKIGDGVRNINELPFANGGSNSSRILSVFPEYNMIYDDLIYDYVYQYASSEVKVKNIVGKTADMSVIEGPRCLYLNTADSAILENTLVIS